ncbi:MAG: FAD-dependent oxidoreductase [Cyclobacteriaceae bacterium]|nr:FAD-dependent oxidoreductase [Cyclobacteriaceae bacterium]
MKRRKALKKIGIGFTAGALMPGMIVSCSKDDPGPEVPYDGTVIIIGAGAAGLYAADILHSKGISVKVLEASNQLGGRIRSLRNQKEILVQTSADFPVELGAEIIYGNSSAFGKIIEKYALTKIELNTQATEQFILDSQAKSATDWGGDSDLAAVRNFVAALPTYGGGDVSMKQAAGVSPRADALLNSMAGNFYGSSSDQVGAKGVSEALGLIEHENNPFIIKTNPLQDIIASRFSQITNKVQLNAVVKSINYAGEKILITDKEGIEYEADKVIVTTSLGVLKSGGVTFSPGLPAAKVAGMNKIGMDHCVRLAIDFKKNFWGEDSGYIWGATLGPLMLNSGVDRSEFYRTLTVTVHGPKAQELSAMGDGILDAVLAELDAIYNNQASLFISKVINPDGTEGNRIWFLADWGKDEFFKGGMSYLKVGASVADREALAAPINNKIFFAGEATDVKGDAGTINGALNSAERVAEELIQTILSA